ncbi:MAG: ShlB/FhaC/HecB family hemolysin secretion/activation protein [Candidatus Omnitrophica bacterium]|nr:ShlB/FhaC/HecB family hemolysin secretion/activation protein [Candidatus Omnitrophota bacterium]
MNNRNTIVVYIGVLLIALAGVVIYSPIASAVLPPNIQSMADQASREVDTSLREEAEKKLSGPQQEPTPIKKEEPEEEVPEGPSFFVKDIKITGVKSVSPDIFDTIIERYENKDVSLEQLNVLAKQIEREYLRKGVIAACFLPPQDIEEGIVTLRVVEAQMGKLKIEGGRFFLNERIKYYWNIRPGEVLRYDKMSKSLQFMNKNPDRDVSATLHAGEKPGTTDVLLVAKTQFPVHVFYTYDHEGNVSTGRIRQGMGIRSNNVLGLDDTLLTGYTWGRSFSGFYIYHTLPVTNFGTSVMYGYSDSRSVPKKEFTIFGIGSRSQNTSFYVHQDIYNKKAEYAGEIAFGFDANDKVTTTNEGTITRNRFRIIRVKGTYVMRRPGSILYFNPKISQGINGFGSRRKRDRQPDQATQISSFRNTFTKANLALSYTQILPFDIRGHLRMNSQFASEHLASQEQFALGGIDSVRGYPSQDYMADNAFSTSVELRIPPYIVPKDWRLPYAPETIRDSVTGIVFFDQAWGGKRGALADGERRQWNLASVGTGLRIRAFNQMLLRLEWGFIIGNHSMTERADSRFHISLNLEDKIPEEIERILREIHENNLRKTALRLVDNEMKRPDSPVRKKIYSYLDKARKADAEGDLKAAKIYYTKIKNIANSLYKQSEEYISRCIKQQEKLEASNKLAMENYKAGDIDRARSIWEKVVKDAQIKPLVLEM